MLGEGGGVAWGGWVGGKRGYHAIRIRDTAPCETPASTSRTVRTETQNVESINIICPCAVLCLLCSLAAEVVREER